MKWLFFSYSLPTEPSKARVFVWRQLKKLGAINYQSFWVLPYSTEHVNELNKLIEDIEHYKGEGMLIEGKALNKEQKEKIYKALIDSRNEEYHEVIQKCEDFLKEIEFEIGRKNFIFAEVEENEEELEKLKQWFKKVGKRDFLKAPLHKKVIEKIKSCEKMFDDFARRVYEHTQSSRKTVVKKK
jgi:hypothetical protein